ncbi:hypothetical protein GCM10027275_25400 [Rhabdobacter roseus]|uniref:Uncharacterized protein n=1 Tax=Rhabdobacter roseus TaxID=1655419 RepID=A0A840TM55_9BACT|nr:hypothetical protein [Rhabdobacter roseus]MBB5284484.1 hypothetical protein [Rhabdobacter roseus]
MSLQVGDFFEGSYQLQEELVPGRRWLSLDWTLDQPAPVVIELIPAHYDENLHWHPAQVPGLRRLGQSRALGARYLVWEADQSRESTPLLLEQLTPDEKRAIFQLIDTLPVAAGEAILSVNTPEYWRLGPDRLLLFYRKQLSVRANAAENEEIKRFWKETLPGDKPVALPEVPQVEDAPEVQSAETTATTTAAETSPASPKYYAYFVLAIGTLLAIAVWYTKESQGAPDPIHVPVSPSLAAFDQALNRGIAEEKRGEFQRAMEYFRMVARMPYSPEIRVKVDSLAQVYEARAQADCERFRESNSPNLYHIPDQYYQYAALLAETTPKRCE